MFDRRSTVSFSTMVKGVRSLAPHPWIFNKLIALQLAKWFFPTSCPGVQHGKAGKIHQVSIRITDLCNLRCHTCGQWGDNGFMHGTNLQKLSSEEVSPELYSKLFDDLTKNKHYPNIYLWGGEPTLYKGLFQVIENATKQRLPVSIATNGHGLMNAAARFVDIPLFLLQVSVDGHSETIHNRVRPSAGNGDAFHDVVTGLEAVSNEKRKKKKKLPIVATLTVISKENVNHLVDIYNRFKGYTDVMVFYLSWWIDEEQAQKHTEDYFHRFGEEPKLHRGWIGKWKPEDFNRLSSQLIELKKLSRSIKNPAVTILPDISSAKELQEYYTNHNERFGYNRCISIYQALELNSNGDISPCRDYHDYVVGNIKEDSIIDLWNCDKFSTFRQNIEQNGLMVVCNRCCGLMGY